MRKTTLLLPLLFLAGHILAQNITPVEKKIIDAEIKRLVTEKKYSKKIVTEVKPVSKFYPAEDYHQEYILNNPDNPYVKNVSIPDYLEFRKKFKGNFKP